MFRKKDYNEYPLIISGDHFNGFQYALKIYCRNKELLMLIDTGAELCQIGNKVLKDCQYYNTKQSQQTMGLGGSLKQRRVLVEFDLAERGSSEGKYQFGLDFLVVNKKDNPYFNMGYIDGILGSNFLSFCDINLREGFIRVYNKPRF